MSLLTFSCGDKEHQNCELVGCTEEFKTITLELVDTDGKPVQLTDYYTFQDEYNQFKVEADRPDSANANYPVISDAEINRLKFEGHMFIFVGLIDEEIVVEHQLLLGRDCCHVQLFAGEEQVVVDLNQ